MIWLSLLIVSGVLTLIGVNLDSEAPDVRFGAGLLIAGRVPWLVLLPLWGGVGLAALSLRSGRRLPKAGILLLEVSLVGYVTWYVVAGSALPAHALTVEVGDAFPAYALENQDGGLEDLAALEERPPALYIFYRGHW